MKHDIPKLDRQGLRKFGLVTGAIVAGVFGLMLPWLFGFRFPLWPWIVFGVLGSWALIAPTTLGPVYRGWMRFGLVLNWINTRIILGLVYYLMVIPTGVIMRLLGKDPMVRAVDKDVKSYRVPSRKLPREHMEKPF
jgi:hypothetical protein